jgi:hypothetical protein
MSARQVSVGGFVCLIFRAGLAPSTPPRSDFTTSDHMPALLDQVAAKNSIGAPAMHAFRTGFDRPMLPASIIRSRCQLSVARRERRTSECEFAIRTTSLGASKVRARPIRRGPRLCVPETDITTLTWSTSAACDSAPARAIPCSTVMAPYCQGRMQLAAYRYTGGSAVA